MSRRRILLSLLLVTAVGFGCKFYGGPAAGWVRNSLAGAFYEIFWCLSIFLVRRRPSPAKIALSVFAVTTALEFLQLVRHPALEPIRANFVGQALVGNQFTWADFPYYVAGCFAGWVWMKKLKRSGSFR
ncbi:MAG: DUF2809 domain-containing protein [Candidatus Eisenbacteria bacterium]